MTLVRKDPDKGDVIYNFRSITLLHAEVRILAKVLAKVLASAVDGIVGKAHICGIPGSTFQDNFQLVGYTL